MKTSFKNTPNNRGTKKSTTPPGNGNVSATIFSSTVKRELPVITFHQKETNYSLSLRVKETARKLTIRSFTLLSNEGLEDQSYSLYDAALIELVLQGLEWVFAAAEQRNRKEVHFLLDWEDFDHLDSFQSYFHTILYSGHQISLVLPTTPEAYAVFKKRMNGLHKKIRNELWLRQREDDVLKHYLQNRHQKDFSLFQNSPSLELQSSSECTIIAFPIGGKKRSEV